MDKRWRNLVIIIVVILAVLIILSLNIFPNVNQNLTDVLNGSKSNLSEDDVFNEDIISFESNDLIELDDSALNNEVTVLNANVNSGTNQNKDISKIYLDYVLLLEKRNTVISELEDDRSSDLSCDSLAYHENLNLDINDLINKSNDLSDSIDEYIENYYSDEVVESVTRKNITDISLVLNELANTDFYQVNLTYLSLKEAC